MVTLSESGDARPDLRDHPGAFVSHDQRGRDRPFAAPHVQVAVADAGGGDPDLDLARAGRIEIDVA